MKQDDIFLRDKHSFYEIETVKQLQAYMDHHIVYGWVDCDQMVHKNEMNDFRRLYRTRSVADTVTYGVGTCT